MRHEIERFNKCCTNGADAFMHEVIELNRFTSEGRLFLDHGPNGHVKAYIPSHWPANHASNLIELDNGDLLCCWFAGLSEGSSDIKIALSRLNADSDRWSEPVLVSEDYTRSEQNPSLFQTPSGQLWLMYTAQCSRGRMRVEEWYEKVRRGEVHGHFSMQETAEVRLRRSDDRGYTFGAVESLFTKPGAFGRHPALRLSNGDFLYPMWYSQPEEDASKPQYGGDYSVVQISGDQGRSWTEYPVPDSVRRVHMAVVETRPGRLVAFFRSRSADRIYRAFSTDYGRTWTAPAPTRLPNNNASIQAIRLQSGRILLAFNNYGEGDDPLAVRWPGRRCPVTLALTEDEGETFPYMRSIETGENFLGDGQQRLNRQYHYPSIIQSRDGLIHVSYSFHGRDCIFYHQISEDWITGSAERT